MIVSNKARRFQSIALGVLFSISIASLSHAVYAAPLTRWGPNPADFANLPEISYHLSNSTSTPGDTYMAVPIYFPSSDPTLIPSGGVTVTIAYVSGSSTSGSGLVRFGYDNTAAGPATWSGSTNPGSVTIPRASFVLDPNNPGRLRAFIHAELYPASSFKAFRFTAPSGYLIGFSASVGSVFAVGNRNRCDAAGQPYCGLFYDYNLDFAPPCGLASGVATLTIMDADNASTITDAQYQKVVSFVIRDLTTNSVVPLSGTINYTNGALSYLTFNFISGHKYRLEMGDVYTNNVIQVRVPFDSVYAQDTCPVGTPWIVTGTSSSSPATALPGQSGITFTHTLSNTGTNSSPSIFKAIFNTNSVGSFETLVSGTNSTSGVYTSGQVRTYTETINIPASATRGQQYCQRIGWDPASSDGTTVVRNGRSTPACVTVVYDYDLQPNVINPPPSTTMFGQPITFTYQVQNTGTKTNSTAMGYRQIIIPPGIPFPAGFGEHGPGASCGTYAPAPFTMLIKCATVPLPSTTFLAGETRTVHTEVYTPPSNLAAGTRICRALSVDSRDENPAPNNRDSAVVCTVISRAPYLSIVNGDASAGGSTTSPYIGDGKFTGSNTSTSGFGSFGEYGVIATGSIQHFSTAGILNSPNSRSLMFANTPVLTTSGQFQTSHMITDYVSRFAARGNAGTAAPASPALLTINGGSQDYKAPVAGDITVNANNPLAAGRKYLIYAPGRDVTIAGNIEYAPTVNSFKDAPSVIIVAKNIRINANVTRVDALLVAVDAVSTCSEAGRNLSEFSAAAVSSGGVCDTRLTINGAVIAGQIYTPRAAGGATSSDLPAELFSMRPEVFLEPYEAGEASFVLQTDSEKELPPRN